MNDENPSFYAIIPASVRYAKITPNAKLLYGEITALCNKDGYCYASNKYFAELYCVSKISISKWIKELIDNKFITSEIIYKEGTKEILNRYIRILYDPIKENFNTPIKEKFKDNNTYINNTYNKKEIYKEKFDEFYKSYPRKESKLSAEKSFIRVLKEKKATFEELMEGVRKYSEKCKKEKTEKKYIKHPSTWLNQGCWADEYEDSYESSDLRGFVLPNGEVL